MFYCNDGKNRLHYDRNNLRPRIAHIGCGAFHRAHQAVYTDLLAEQQQSDWGYCEISLQHGQRLMETLRQQDGLYAVVQIDNQGWQQRIVGVICQSYHAGSDGIEAVLNALSQPEIAIVSLTITEKGYCITPATGTLDEQHPAIIADLAQPECPQSAVGVIVAALDRRWRLNRAAFTVLSCDNMPGNGQITRQVVLAYAAKRDPSLAQWISDNASFPATMVDRIVPAITPQRLQQINEITGCHDLAAVVCEPFRQWVIEDNFVAGRPEWQKAGAQWVTDVAPYEAMKLRMLNGSHSFLAYLGYLAGYKTIHQCLQDDDFFNATRRFMLDEQRPTLQAYALSINLIDYAEQLLACFSNQALPHQTWQIAMDGSQKLPQRWLTSIRYHLQQQTPFPLLALAVAGWIHYVSGTDEQGHAIDIRDPLLNMIQQAVKQSSIGVARVRALCQLEAIFGHDLPHSDHFMQAVEQAYLALVTQGVKNTLAEFNR